MDGATSYLRDDDLLLGGTGSVTGSTMLVERDLLRKAESNLFDDVWRSLSG